jgi:hypothetical protein
MRVVTIIFSSLHQGVVLSRNPDGSYAWSRGYDGADIKSAPPIDDGRHCILLLDPDVNTKSAFENLPCIDRLGRPVWTAKLPTSPDGFVAVRSTPDGLVANTWSGIEIFLDQYTGLEMNRVFVK